MEYVTNFLIFWEVVNIKCWKTQNHHPRSKDQLFGKFLKMELKKPYGLIHVQDLKQILTKFKYVSITFFCLNWQTLKTLGFPYFTNMKYEKKLMLRLLQK